MTRLLWLADVARAAGLDVVEEPGWRTRGKAAMKPLLVVNHHTATKTKGRNYPTRKILINGHGSLRGPLCHYGLARDGTVYVVASGKANHAGWRLRSKRPGVPKGAPHQAVQGNVRCIGIEADGHPDEPWPAAQIDAWVRLNAAIIQHLGWGTNNIIGHMEWAPRRKFDPYGLPGSGQWVWRVGFKWDVGMEWFRGKVSEVLAPPAPTPPPTPAPPPATDPKLVAMAGQLDQIATQLRSHK